MSIKHDLKRSIHQILGQNKQGAYATRADRQHILMRFAEDVVSLGYGLRDIRGLKEKHVRSVVDYWQSRHLSTATLKNRVAAVRRLASFINKPAIVPSNTHLNISARSYKPQFNRAIVNPDFSGINNAYVYHSLQLQRAFGLRREESLKIQPHLADKGEYLELQPSWCKGGRGRQIPIRTEEQRHWLEQAKALVGNYKNSLIPPSKTYIQQQEVYDKQVSRAKLGKLHGLRHAYAQARYKGLTGWEAPINGGPTFKELTLEQRKIDYEARMTLTEQIGHSRPQILVNYLGR